MARNSSLRWLIGGGVVVAAISAISFLELGEQLVYFYTPSEAQAKALELDGKNIKVGGMVKPGTVDWKPETLALNFVMSDLNGHEIAVAHKGTPPDMFKQGQGVVVEGRITGDGKQMTSKALMVKHSEEYKKPANEHESMNKALLEKSLFKDGKP